MYVSASQLKKDLSITGQSLRRWGKAGDIRTIRTPGGHFRYHVEDVQRAVGTTVVASDKATKDRRKIIYARVSSGKQKDDLKRQEEKLREHYPSHEVITDVASGINFKRKGFLRLVDSVLRGDVEELVVSHRDRLCRFAFDFVAWICDRGDTRLVVQDAHISSAEQELTEDLVSLL
ncbi:unnamed protein product, partial [Chrysoparadoxa australica]